MEQTKKNKRSKRTIILTVVMMAAVFLFLVYLNQRPYAHIEVHSLSDLNAQQIVQTAASKMRLEPENLRVTPSGKVTFDIDEAGKLVRPLQFDLHGISGENVQTATLLLRKPGLYLYRNQTEKLPKNGQTQQQQGPFEITDRKRQCLFTITPHTGHVSDFQNRVQIVMDMGAGNEGQGNSFQ